MGKTSHRKHLSVVGAMVAIIVLVVAGPVSAKGFVHGIVINVDGMEYYMAGPPDGPGGARDIPGHYWVQAGRNRVVGKHYNSGPFGMPQWWSSDAADGELLFIVNGIIDTWSVEKAASYAARGYVHYHELVKVSNGSQHPTKVVWLKHTARTSFTLDGGPHPPDPGLPMKPGVAYNFLPQWWVPYTP